MVGLVLPGCGEFKRDALAAPEPPAPSGRPQGFPKVPSAPELHQENLRDVLGKKAAVLVFATPQLCQSRVCGPAVDVALQVKAAVGDDVVFVHQEVYKDNVVEKGVRPQLGAWRLVTEPWTFVIDREGIVRARFEGALSADELRRAVAAVE